MLTSVKLKNQLLAIDPQLIVELRRASVNGVTMGCDGFVTNPVNGKVVYVSTDNNHGLNSKSLYRTAKNIKDYTGGPNMFAEYSDTAQAIVNLLNK